MKKSDCYEVELKYPLTDAAVMEERIAAMGGIFDQGVIQRDTYFRHPARDFRQTDEALRIRQIGDQSRVTFKGPKLDQTTKTRRELEFAIEHAAEHYELFELLGFSAVYTVEKTRRTAHFQFQGLNIEACWDNVKGLGEFIELELVANAEELEAARSTLLELARQLQLENSQRRGYLDMLMDQQEGSD